MTADKTLPDGRHQARPQLTAPRLVPRAGASHFRTAFLAGLVFLGGTAHAQTYYSEQRYATINDSPLAGPVVGTNNRISRNPTARHPAGRPASTARTSYNPQAVGGGDWAASYAPVHVQQGQQPCWDAAAHYQNVKGLNPWLLYAVAYVESRHNPNAIGRNTNGSYDLGLMQINSTWFPTLRKYGIQPQLLTNACASTFVGAWVLAQTIHRYGFTWQAIAAYNVGSVDTPRRRAIGYAYAKKVYEAYDLLTKRAGLVPGARVELGMGPMIYPGMHNPTGIHSESVPPGATAAMTLVAAQDPFRIPGVTGNMAAGEASNTAGERIALSAAAKK